MPHPSLPRVTKLRDNRRAAGIKRRDLYAHDDDWPAIRDAAKKKADRRMRKSPRE
jgi:hypothetical protein